MTKKLEQLSNEQVKILEDSKKIEYVISATLSGLGWVHIPEEYHNAVLKTTDTDILEKSDFYEITSHENGMQIVPYEQARGGAINVYSFFVNFFRNTAQNVAGERK